MIDTPLFSSTIRGMSLCHNHSPTAILFTSLNVFLLIIIYFNGFEYRSVQILFGSLRTLDRVFHKAKDEQKIVRKRKIFLEVEVSEDEYQAFMKQTK